MSCQQSGKRAGDAARRNGIWGQVSRYLNTIGSWRTYRDLTGLEQIPERLEQVTSAFFGLKGLGEQAPRLSSILGVIIGIHAMEQATGAVATTAMRLWGRGKPLSRYRGVIVRESPLTPRTANILNRLSGGRVLAARGYYFHEGGRTWQAQSFTMNVRGTPRTLTQVRSLSIPHREHFFDRPLTLGEDEAAQVGDDGQPRHIPVQRVVDTVLGDEAPDNIPGYIGSTNEIENVGALGGVKRALFMANWFLVDESERDMPGPDFVDYDALVKGEPSRSSNSDYYRVSQPVGGSGGAPGSTYGYWPSTTPRTTAPQSYGTSYFRSSPPPSVPAAPPGGGQGRVYTDPYEQINERYHASNGQHYPLVVKRLMTNPVTGSKRVDAVYYDGELKRWREIDDTAVRESLAREVDAGTLKVTPPEAWPAM